MIYHIFIYKETCFVAPVECYERGDTSYEQASNSKQEPATKHGDREIYASTSKPVIKDTLPESDDLIVETSDSFSVSEIIDSVTFPGIPAISNSQRTDSVFFPVIPDSPIPDSVSISEIADSPILINESLLLEMQIHSPKSLRNRTGIIGPIVLRPCLALETIQMSVKRR